jgi:C_GCAxxG_C_C family probable redox protein
MSNVEIALASFSEGFSCSQAVLSAFAPGLGLDRPTALRVAAAFGGGMARMAQTCGAVTGALMVIGLKHGHVAAEDKATKEMTYALVRQFVDEFRARNRALLCRDLLGCDIGTPEGMQLFREKSLNTLVCSRLVRDAAEILERLT